MPGELATQTDQPAIPANNPMVAAVSRRAFLGVKAALSGAASGTTEIGSNMQNTGVNNTRACMKSPPWRIQYTP